MASSGWKVINPNEFWESGLAYLDDFNGRILAIRYHPDRYYDIEEYRSYTVQLVELREKIDRLAAGETDPMSLPPASKHVFYEGTSILKPINLLKPDYRRLTFRNFSALYRLNYSERPPVCFGVRIFFNADEPKNLEFALEILYQQIIKKMRG